MEEEILKRLKILRVKKGLTQAEISEKLGFSSPIGYLKIENGQTDLKLSHLTKLSAIFEVTIKSILGFDEKENSVEIYYLEKKVNELQENSKEYRYKYASTLTDYYTLLKRYFFNNKISEKEIHSGIEKIIIEFKQKINSKSSEIECINAIQEIYNRIVNYYRLKLQNITFEDAILNDLNINYDFLMDHLYFTSIKYFKSIEKNEQFNRILNEVAEKIRRNFPMHLIA